ncbi:MAG: flagellar basal body rod protein FlgB [Steroidobacteraceae bacterium]
MRTALDNYLGIHPQALQLESKRNELLAANLANVDTPNYKARDLDFKSALAAASGDTTGSSGALPLRAPTSTASLGASNGTAAAASGTPVSDPATGIDASLLKYRVPMAPSLDGNTVDEQLEQSAFAENNVRYQATLTFLNSALRDLMTAITGS